jgi:hypothetical protein
MLFRLLSKMLHFVYRSVPRASRRSCRGHGCFSVGAGVLLANQTPLYTRLLFSFFLFGTFILSISCNVAGAGSGINFDGGIGNSSKKCYEPVMSSCIGGIMRLFLKNFKGTKNLKSKKIL